MGFIGFIQRSLIGFSQAWVSQACLLATPTLSPWIMNLLEVNLQFKDMSALKLVFHFAPLSSPSLLLQEKHPHRREGAEQVTHAWFPPTTMLKHLKDDQKEWK